MARVFTNGKMVDVMKENTKKIKNMDMENIHLVMEEFTWVSGKTENNMVKDW